MFWKLIGRKIFYPLVFLSLILWWIIATESGLKTTVWVIKHFLPGTLNFQKLEGTLTDTIQIQKIQFDSPDFTLTAESFSIQKPIHILFNNTLSLDSIITKKGELLLKNEKNPLTIDWEGNIFNLKLNSKKLGDFVLSATLVDQIKILNPFLDPTLKGTFSYKINDLRLITRLIPAIARPTGSLSATLEMKGPLKNPILYLNATLSNGLFYLPKDRIKIKNLSVSITGNILDKLTIQGTGNSGEGQFQLKGSLEPLKSEGHHYLKLTGKNLRLHNTANIYIIASPDLILEYTDPILYIEGSVHIPKGFILQPEEKIIRRSQDVVYLHPSEKPQEVETIKVIPSIMLLIDEGFHYRGHGLDATLSGKLHIEQRSDGLYSGNGRLTIIEGKYRIQGITHYIHRGRLLFIPGTLLNNPLLDIRLIKKASSIQNESTEVGLYVQGTLQKPEVQLFSSAHLQDAEILSRLGLGGTESTGSQQGLLRSHTAQLLAVGANPFIEQVQSSIGLEEVNIESKESLNTLNTLGSTNTVLVLGRPLSKRVYLQFIQGLLEPTSSIRLKYALTRYLTTSVETGTEGTGTDLTFTREAD